VTLYIFAGIFSSSVFDRKMPSFSSSGKLCLLDH
jgi:hypothetical protein